MGISCQLLATGILYLMLMPLVSMAQDVVPYPKSEVKVDWVQGTDFSLTRVIRASREGDGHRWSL
jgi:hypothetical protein